MVKDNSRVLFHAIQVIFRPKFILGQKNEFKVFLANFGASSGFGPIWDHHRFGYFRYAFHSTVVKFCYKTRISEKQTFFFQKIFFPGKLELAESF